MGGGRVGASTRAARARFVYRAWRYRFYLDRPELTWVLGALRTGDVAFDIGAHKGAYTYWMRRAVGATGQVVAFEPQPTLAGYLRSCVAGFGWKNVVVERVGLSSACGVRALHVPGGTSSPSASFNAPSDHPEARSVDVQVDTIDAFLAREVVRGPPRLIKCDVEGHELEVLRGGRGALADHRPRLLVECEARHRTSGDVSEVFDFLGGIGYSGFFFWRGRRIPVSAFDPATHQVPGRRPYANNFLFE